MVAGQHRHAHAHSPERADRGGCARAQRVDERQPTHDARACGNADDRVPGSLDLRELRGIDRHSGLGEERGGTQSNGLVAVLAADTASRVHPDVADRQRLQGERLGALDDRERERMGRALLEAHRELEQLALRDSVGRMYAGEAGRADRQRPGLVDDERVDPLGALERRGILDQDARLRAAVPRRPSAPSASRAPARTGRRSPAPRSRASAPPPSRRRASRSRRASPRRWRAPPARIAPTRGRRAAAPAPSSPAPRPPAARSPPAASRLPTAVASAAQRTGFVDGAGQHDVARGLRDRLALAGQHRLVHRRFAGEHTAIHRHAVAGANDEHVANAAPPPAELPASRRRARVEPSPAAA